ncbi:glycosyltransferase [Geomesophilobacter sediminis]|uniref:Glycosyltransferase n=1 Tax=Geomesophilobacter sediminis TaxID=2798584 RepID=A0A8J7M1T3_9BACT|nr:glycosyltransferase [Geomesophilobacter sediminis]MBJ6727095.1 glycosyltransferase [Geomesophilobacter sediminis]
MPKVSVIIPTYNCGQFIGKALDSVLKQTFLDYEIIVMDDGSTDATASIVANYQSVRYFYQINRGLPAARNAAVSRANGEYLAYLDADDLWYPEKLRQQVSFLDATPRCGIVHADLTYVDENDAPFIPLWHHQKRGAGQQGECLEDLLHNCLIQVPTVMERHACFDQTGGFDERFRRVEDYLHWIHVALRGHQFGYIDRPLAMYRWRSGSLSKNSAAMLKATVQMFQVLMEETDLNRNSDASDIVAKRIAMLKRLMPGALRREGDYRLARQTALKLLLDFPKELNSYVELFKSSLPEPLLLAARKMRSSRSRTGRNPPPNPATPTQI